jgi:two-component system, cell cycle response regulator DivK
VKTILIVDDDAASLALVERVLEAEGYQTKSASTPEQALEVLKGWTPSAILLDIQLQGLDNGLEFSRRLKSNVATTTIPIIAFTAYSDTWTEAEARAAGCDGYLVKPITARMLADTIRKTVGEAG